MLQQFELLALEVFGNDYNGYQVNGAYKTGQYLFISDLLETTDVFDLIYKQLGMKGAKKNYSIDIDDMNIVVRTKSGRPCYHLELCKG